MSLIVHSDLYKNSKGESSSQNRGHDHRTMVARSATVPEATRNECSSTNTVTNDHVHFHSTQHSFSRASEKQKLEYICLECQCHFKLQKEGWSPQTITFHNLSIANSTKQQYNKVIQEYKKVYWPKHREIPLVLDIMLQLFLLRLHVVQIDLNLK